MKPSNVSVSVVDMAGELYINATFLLPGALHRELNPKEQVSEKHRKQVQKAIRQALLAMEITYDE